VIRFVITANGKNGAIAPDDAMCAFESLEFGSFDIHFDEGDAFVGEGIIEPHARHFATRTGGDRASAHAIAGEVYDPVVRAHGNIAQDGPGAHPVYEALELRQDGWVRFECDHFAEVVAGLGDERLQRISGVGPAIDEAFIRGQGKDARKVLVARERVANAVEVGV
jgi:hypothetical protein